MNAKQWRMLDSPPPGFAREVDLPPFQAHLLFNRGVRNREGVEQFLLADSRLHNDPMLLPDMGTAVTRLKSAIENHERIGVFGDFDADGITGTAVATIGLRDLNADVVPYLPDRVDEGHGLNDAAVMHLRDEGVSKVDSADTIPL